MRRRSFLATITSGTVVLSGCIASSSGQSDGDTSGDPPADARREVQNAAIGGVPDDAPVSFEVTVADPWITSSSTAAFSVTTVNETEEEQSVRPAFITGLSSDFGPKGVVCYNHVAADFDIEEYAPPCYSGGSNEAYVRVADVSKGDDVVFARYGYGTDTISPRDSREGSVIVADDPTVDGCFPPDSYRVVDRTIYDMELSFEIASV